jgi:hypothetical protein
MSSISTVNFSSSFEVPLFTAYSDTVSRASVDCIQTVIFTTSELSDTTLSVNKQATKHFYITETSFMQAPNNTVQS